MYKNLNFVSKLTPLKIHLVYLFGGIQRKPKISPVVFDANKARFLHCSTE
jgi:hypothetical protein